MSLFIYLYFILGVVFFLSSELALSLVIFYSWLVSVLFLYFEGLKLVLLKRFNTIIITRQSRKRSSYRSFCRMRNFWKKDFQKSYKNEKIWHLIWEIPFLVGISFYNLLNTRFQYITNLFFFRCLFGILVLREFIGIIFLISYFFPLVVLTILAGIPTISNHLNKVYGKNTLKKIGFNVYWRFLEQNGVNIVKGAFSLCVLDGTAGVANETISRIHNNHLFNQAVLDYKIDLHRVQETLGQNPNFKQPKLRFPLRTDPEYNRKVFITVPEIREFLREGSKTYRETAGNIREPK